MTTMVLVPAVYRCPDHDNHEEITERVHARVEVERMTRPGATAAPFRVAVTCPGRAGEPETAHRRAYDGEWTVRVPAVV